MAVQPPRVHGAARLHRKFFLAKPARAGAFLYDPPADMHKAVRS